MTKVRLSYLFVLNMLIVTKYFCEVSNYCVITNAVVTDDQSPSFLFICVEYVNCY